MREGDGDVGGEGLQDDLGVDGGVGRGCDARAEDVSGRKDWGIYGQIRFVGCVGIDVSGRLGRGPRG